MTDAMAGNLNTLFERRLRIIHSQGQNPNAAGVAFVVNRDITNADQAVATEVTPGRAMSITLPWHGDQKLTVLNVYAPNQPTTNGEFWDDLNLHYSGPGRTRPDIMLGDLNIVEDSLDRIPGHPDSISATTALQSLRNKIKVVDGWRHTHPDEKDFSFMADATGSQSRIDRIYVSQPIMENAFEWGISTTAIKTDHRLVSVRIAQPDAPDSGPGRWAMPAVVLRNKEFIDHAVARGHTLTDDIDGLGPRSLLANVQMLYKTFKDDLRKTARNTAKRLIPKIKQQIERLGRDRLEVLNRPNTSEDDAKHSAGIIEERIRELESKRHEKARMTVKVTDTLEGEIIGPYLTALNAHRRPKEVLRRLRIPQSNPPSYTTNTRQMTRIAKDHHDALQREDEPWAPERRNLTIENLCNSIQPEDKFTEPDAAYLGRRIEKQDVITALKDSASAKAPGLDGIPYELWDALSERHALPLKGTPGERVFDVMTVLTILFNDIEDFGAVDSADFAEGWLCPIYKKNDRTNIANYRPITLLNSDYKIFTKILASRLAKVAHKVIHKAQAGFIPNRSISDQVRLAKLMTDYSEATEENGMIVCLDQEKAYDKIKHDYLWITLREYGLPEHFIDTVKTLYKFARTQVMVNREMSDNFQVTRGVRQGDPLSGLLFNLAIEPLANTLRLSPHLHGFQLPGSTEKLIATLFADDTTIYMSETDDFRHLQVELDRWCLASGARFNVTKTEVIPLGTIEYRQKLRDTRRNKEGGTRLQSDIHITAEGEASRSLGGWIGNNIEQTQVWTKTLDKVQASLDRWAKGRPTLHLKAKIVQITVGAMTQYLTTVQGMPRSVEDKLDRMTKDFLWDGAKAPLKMDLLYRPLDEGGLGLLDLRSRNEAIDLRWCRTYLDLGETRPTWTLVADVLFEDQIPKTQGTIDHDVTINQFVQTWRPNISGTSRLPKDLIRLITVSRKHNVKLEALRLTTTAKKSLPAWYHIGSETHPGRLHSRNTSSCLKRQHKTMKVKDMVAVTKRLRYVAPGHRHSRISTCSCKYCRRDRSRGCPSPWRCCDAAQGMLDKLHPQFHPLHNPEADNLSLTPVRLEDNASARVNGGDVLFNPSLLKGEDLAPNFRVFGKRSDLGQPPAFRRQLPQGIPEDDPLTVFTSGACVHIGQEHASAGGGIWYGEGDPRNAALHIPGDHRSSQSGEVAAILHAAQNAPHFAHLSITSTSSTAVDALTKNLHELEESGYFLKADKDLLRLATASLRERGAKTSFRLATTEDGRLAAAALAKAGSVKAGTGGVVLSAPARFHLDGTQLSALTQARAYSGIRETKPAPYRLKTDIRLDMTRHAVLEASGKFPTNATIWAALRHTDIARNIRNFLWKTTHQVQKIGEFWESVPTLEIRSICQSCGDIEDMDHILFTCREIGCKEVWSLAKQLWGLKGGEWPNPRRTSDVLAATLADLKTEDGERRRGATRLYKIIATESAFLIWKLRNERIFGTTNSDTGKHTHTAARNRWLSTINAHLRLDIATTHGRWGRGQIPRETVLSTWRNTLHNEANLPEDWTTKKCEVLVGIRPFERRQGRPHMAEPG